jgi:mRNA interferase MazF
MGIVQYEIVLVNLDPTIGSEIKKTRPCVVISPDEINRNLQTIVIAPMTTNLKNYPTRVKVNFKKKEGRIVIDQLRTIDNRRIIKSLGKISTAEIKEVKRIIHITYVE